MADPRPTRLYKCSDAKFMTAAEVLIKHFNTHKADFLSVRGDMADPFGPDLALRITAASTHLGETGNQGAKPSTAPLAVLKETAKAKVKLLKDTIESKFKTAPADKNKYLSALGLDLHYRRFYAGSDDAANELYTKMNKGLPTIKAELVAHGLAATLMTNALDSLQPLQPLNVTQEAEKIEGLGLTDAGILEFNAVYKILIDICGQGKALFASNPAVREKFVWENLIR